MTTKNKPEVFRISGARKGLTEDVRGRQRRYVVSMVVRTVFFVLTIVIPSPYRWFCLAGALVLPYVAVVIANAGREPVSDPPDTLNVPPQAPRAIEPPPGAVLTSGEQETLRGEARWKDEAAEPAREASPRPDEAAAANRSDVT